MPFRLKVTCRGDVSRFSTKAAATQRGCLQGNEEEETRSRQSKM